MTTTHIARSLLLVVVLAVSWAAAVPLPNGVFIEDTQTFLEQHPFIARELYSQQLNERRKRDTDLSGDIYRTYHSRGHSDTGSGTLTHSFDDNHAFSVTGAGTRDTISGLGSLDTLSAGGGYHYSPRDDTTFSLGATRNWREDGVIRTDAGANLEHHLNNEHSLSGNFGASRTDVPGFDSFNTHSGGLNYNWTPNRNTRFSLGAHTSRSPFGRDNGVGASFTHFFGR